MLERFNGLVAGVPHRPFLTSFDLFLLATLCVSSTFISCGGSSNSSPNTPAQPSLESISISPQSAIVAAGLTQQYTATGNYSDGSSNSLSTAKWTTSNSATATVSDNGLVTALKKGPVNISATVGTVAGSTALTVGPPNLVAITVSPSNPSIPRRQSQQFSASGSYTDGSAQTLANVTWNSGTSGVATISATGLATSVVSGTSMISAASGAITGSTKLTVTAPVIPAVNYVLGQTFSSGGLDPQGLVVADFNGDGKPDIAVSNENSNTIIVFLNDGTGNLGNPVTTTLQSTTWIGALAVGDFNQDGKADLALGANGNETLVLLGNGDGTFAQQPAIVNAPDFSQARVVDLNGDGKPDLVLACNGDITVALGNGDGTFTATQLTGGSMPGSYFSVAVADFNGDKKLDVAAVDYGYSSGTLDYWAGNGDGTFATATSANLTLTGAASIANGDFNGDGKQDALISFLNSAGVYFGNGDGTLNLALGSQQPIYSNNLGISSQGVSVFASSLTNDGNIDAVTSDYSVGILQIVFNGALGSVPPANGNFSFALAPGISVIAAGDLNGDGMLDVAVINHETSQVTTILSQKQ